MVLDEKRRAAHLRRLPQRAGAFTRERSSGSAREVNDASRSYRRGYQITRRRPLVLARALCFLSSSLLLAQAPSAPTIRFEDATAASGIQFTHSFGAQKLGSLLEGTGGGCVWFDYN